MSWSPDKRTTSGTDCKDYCIHWLYPDYDGGHSEDSPPRCRCHKYEDECQSHAVDSKAYNEYFKGDLIKQICYYDVCEIVGR